MVFVLKWDKYTSIRLVDVYFLSKTKTGVTHEFDNSGHSME